MSERDQLYCSSAQSPLYTVQHNFAQWLQSGSSEAESLIGLVHEPLSITHFVLKLSV